MAEQIAIASGKGGVGKTWLAITLGHALARLGRRVLLVDGDLGLANIDVQLGIEPGIDLGTVLTGRAGLEQAVHRHGPTGLDIICGRSGSGRLAGQPDSQVEALLEALGRLAAAYEHVLIDLPAGLDPIVRLALRAADRRLVVATDEPTALTDAYALIKVTTRDQARGRLMIGINLARDRRAGADTCNGLSQVCERFLHLRPELLGVVRRDPRVPEAIRHQTPFLLRHPISPAAEDVEAVARVLAAPG